MNRVSTPTAAANATYHHLERCCVQRDPALVVPGALAGCPGAAGRGGGVHHRLDRGGSHYDSGLWGLLAENSMILCMLLLLAVMPWRPGAEPAFPPPGLKHRATLLRSLTDRAGAGRNHAGGIRRDHASGATHDHGSGATRDHAGGAGGSAAARRAQAATPSRSAAGTGGAAAGREDGADPGPVRTGP